ncbi:isochorismatase family protein [Companilactobacillus halodurans]|uniref:Isochorismatase family protein n=1 Tax=Companilactobacillus halodurans TaxID=2584183 RepID=A0A5P0ZTU0_9LACO|nr:isochorismatase family protein [Companilactobacillus halodurans]MQS75992.1 isochorismatase family protein [Companilactobacillus halodurans]MQS96427.1 isochorismatase family protein [Companilactobacillus halodurans]
MSKLAQALIVLDFQKALQYSYDFKGLLKKVNDRITLYRQANLPIIFVQHHDQNVVHDSDLWKFPKELDKQKEDLIVEKSHDNAFFKTNLNELLMQNSIRTLEICGAQTEYTCNATIVMAHGLGYKILMEHDMTTTFDNDYLTAEDTISFFEELWSKRFVEFQ